jgi:hypothetical protein
MDCLDLVLAQQPYAIGSHGGPVGELFSVSLTRERQRWP